MVTYSVKDATITGIRGKSDGRGDVTFVALPLSYTQTA